MEYVVQGRQYSCIVLLFMYYTSMYYVYVKTKRLGRRERDAL